MTVDCQDRLGLGRPKGVVETDQGNSAASIAIDPFLHEQEQPSFELNQEWIGPAPAGRWLQVVEWCPGRIRQEPAGDRGSQAHDPAVDRHLPLQQAEQVAHPQA